MPGCLRVSSFEDDSEIMNLQSPSKTLPVTVQQSSLMLITQTLLVNVLAGRCHHVGTPRVWGVRCPCLSQITNPLNSPPPPPPTSWRPGWGGFAYSAGSSHALPSTCRPLEMWFWDESWQVTGSFPQSEPAPITDTEGRGLAGPRALQPRSPPRAVVDKNVWPACDSAQPHGDDKETQQTEGLRGVTRGLIRVGLIWEPRPGWGRGWGRGCWVIAGAKRCDWLCLPCGQ